MYTVTYIIFRFLSVCNKDGGNISLFLFSEFSIADPGGFGENSCFWAAKEGNWQAEEEMQILGLPSEENDDTM